MNRIKKPIKINTFEKNTTSLIFYPKGWDGSEDMEVFYLDHGMLSFYIETVKNLFDAGRLMRLIEDHQKEKSRYRVYL